MIIHTNAILDANNVCMNGCIQLVTVQRLFRCDECERQRFLVLYIWLSMGCILTSFQSECIGQSCSENGK